MTYTIRKLVPSVLLSYKMANKELYEMLVSVPTTIDRFSISFQYQKTLWFIATASKILINCYNGRVREGSTLH